MGRFGTVGFGWFGFIKGFGLVTPMIPEASKLAAFESAAGSAGDGATCVRKCVVYGDGCGSEDLGLSVLDGLGSQNPEGFRSCRA